VEAILNIVIYIGSDLSPVQTTNKLTMVSPFCFHHTSKIITTSCPEKSAAPKYV